MPLVLSIGSCLCCWPLGIACLVLYFQGKSLNDQGNSVEAAAKFGTVKTLAIIGIVVGVLLQIVNVIIQVAAHG